VSLVRRRGLPVTLGQVTLAVVDIDGVVADVRHRLHYLRRPARAHGWSAFFNAAADDALLPEGARLVAELAETHDIVWLSGRPQWLAGVTRDWLLEHGLPADEMHLRGNEDRRPARFYKLGVLARLRPRGIAAVIDDDAEVIDAALAAGYPAVLVDWVPRTRVLRDAQERAGRT
jgi:phosphoglycolate phosphatase-like HAD superfamily hydrolase